MKKITAQITTQVTIFTQVTILMSISLLSFSALSFSTIAFSHATIDEQASQPLSLTELTTFLGDVSPLDLIHWKVGDTMEYGISLGGNGNLGTMSKSVFKDEGAALWIRQQMKLMTQNENIEILINKADGKVLKLIRNGQEQQIPDDKIEIISQDYTQVTVPAGTFDVLHIVAKTKQVSKIELWANPQAVVMDGVVKQSMATGFGEIVMNLTRFKQGQ